MWIEELVGEIASKLITKVDVRAPASWTRISRQFVAINCLNSIILDLAGFGRLKLKGVSYASSVIQKP